MHEIEYVQLSTLQQQILVLLLAGNEICVLDLMSFMNKRRRMHGLPQITYGSFYPAIKRLELKDFVECIATYSLDDARCRVSLKIKELGKKVLRFDPVVSVLFAGQ